jgi:RNA polymerase sigma-70 factor (ECF subfamily)
MTGEGAEDVTYGDELSRDQEAGSEKDDDLVTRAKSDPEAFGQLYDRYFDPIYRYCSWRLHTQVAAEDATSQIFLKALAGLPGYRPNTSSFRSWLFAIAYHVVVDAYRAHRPMAHLDLALTIPDRDPGPETRAVHAETQREIRSLLAHLPDEQADLLRLRMAGLTDREIAEVVGKSGSAVRTSLHRAIKRLRALMTESCTMTGTGP